MQIAFCNARAGLDGARIRVHGDPDAAGDEEPRRNISMMIMRPPQHGHGCGLGSVASAQLLSAVVPRQHP
jgi:hypothetical protein